MFYFDLNFGRTFNWLTILGFLLPSLSCPSVLLGADENIKFCARILSEPHLSADDKVIALQVVASENKRRMLPKNEWERDFRELLVVKKKGSESLPLFILKDASGKPVKAVFFVGPGGNKNVAAVSDAVENGLSSKGYFLPDGAMMKDFKPDPLVQRLNKLKFGLAALGFGGGILATIFTHDYYYVQMSPLVVGGFVFSVIALKDRIGSHAFNNYLQNQFTSRFLDNDQIQTLALVMEPQYEPSFIRWLKTQGFTDATPKL